MRANPRSDMPLGDTDLVFRPELPADLGSTGWDRHTETIFMTAHRKAASWIRARQPEGDPRLPALALLALLFSLTAGSR